MSTNRKGGNKNVRKVWEKYMRLRFESLFVPFNDKVHSLRDDGSVVARKDKDIRVYEDVGVDYGTFKLKYRITGEMPLPKKFDMDIEV